MFPALQPGDGRPRYRYEVDDVHPTATCPWCRARMALKRNPYGTLFWGCTSGVGCRGTRGTVDHLEPDMALHLTEREYHDLQGLLVALARDELCTWQDGMAAVHARLQRPTRLKHLYPHEVVPARQALLELRERLETERHARQPVTPRVEKSCCETVRDAYGAMTICWAKKRWCLGVAPHATRPEHTADNEGVTWGTGTEKELREDAQEAFREADSRRRR